MRASPHLSSQKRPAKAHKFSTQMFKHKRKLPLLYKFFVLSLALVIISLSAYVIEQKKQRITETAELSSIGLASIVKDHVNKHKLLVQSIAEHHQDRIFDLAHGGGYPYDFDALQRDFNSLLPADTDFVIINQSLSPVLGSDNACYKKICQTLIEQALSHDRANKTTVKVHFNEAQVPYFYIFYPVTVASEQAGLWVKLSLQPLNKFVKVLEQSGYQLAITEQTPPFRALAGTSLDLLADEIQSFDFIEKAESAQFLEHTLSVQPIAGVNWSVIATADKATIQSYTNQVISIASLAFVVLAGISYILFFTLQKLYKAREAERQADLHDNMFNAGPTALLEKHVDRDMTVIYASPNISQLIKKPLKTILNNPYSQLIHPEDLDGVREQLLEAYSQKKSKQELIYRLAMQKEDYKWVYDLSHILYNEAGLPEKLRGYITSVHAQKTAEQNAIDLIQSVPEAIFVMDMQGTILDINQSAESLLGCQKIEITGKQFSHWIMPQEKRDYESLLRLYSYAELPLKGGMQTHNQALQLINEQGENYAIQLAFNEIELHGNTVLIQVVRDVTLQLESQRQLNRAKEEAEALARARSRFVATMSHEIRTPMNGVIGMADLLADTPLNSQQEQYLAAIRESGHVLLRVINEVLDFAKLDEGRVVLHATTTDLKKLCEETMHLMSPLADEKHLTLNLDYATELAQYFKVDAKRLQQVLINLVGNAIKFTKQGHVSMRVSQQARVGSDNGVLQIQVTDTGIGIATEHLPHLFDSFTQADNSSSRQYEGTGLGLAISKQLIELMNGAISVRSKLEEGSQFCVQLPYEPVAVQPAIVTKGIESDNDAMPLQGKRILIVEDNKINQNVIRGFVERLGAIADSAEDGVKGLDYWRLNAQQYGLILMDCQMPVMDGFEATRLIRREEMSGNTQPVPILALTANVLQQNRQDCLQQGMNDFIPKPIQVDDFNKKLIKWCL